jgi:hypothetical protein
MAGAMAEWVRPRGVVALALVLLGFPVQVVTADDCRSLSLRFWLEGYDGPSQSPAEATILREIPTLDLVGAFQPLARLRFLYDKQGWLVGAQDEGRLRISVRGSSCTQLPERLLPVILNPFSGPWRPSVRNPTQRFPALVPSLPR